MDGLGKLGVRLNTAQDDLKKARTAIQTAEKRVTCREALAEEGAG